jgi:DNA primase
MSGLIDESILEQILARIDIVSVISECLPLKRAGRNFKANCPFHNEKTASFMVSAEKQIYHCFGCGAGGNAFNFLMQYERLEFPEAVEKLAKKSGVVIPEKHKTPGSGQTAQILKALEVASEFFGETLLGPQGKEARNYLGKRGVRPETAKEFKLGFAPNSRDALIGFLRARDISLAVMEKAGLAVAKDTGGYADRFRGRVIFTISNMKSEVIGFGARILGDGQPKYLNSPETQVYVKGKNLFNLNLAKDALRENQPLVLVEGYMDCLIPYQAGMRNICASCGTALTPEQAKLIKRFTRDVVVLYDGDSAGQNATLRSFDIFLEEDMNVRIAALPEGDDPDTFVRKNGIEALAEKVLKADNLFDYKLRLLQQRLDRRTPEGKRQIAAEMLPTLRKIPDEVLRGEYMKKLAEELKTSEEILYTELRKVKTDNPYSYRAQQESHPAEGKIHPTEKLLIKLMLEETALISRVKERLDPADFQDASAARFVALMFELVTQGKDCKASTLVNDPWISSIVRESTMDEGLQIPDEEKEQTLHDCIERLKKTSLKTKCRKLQEAIRLAEKENDEHLRTELMVEFNNLIKTR